VEPELKNEYIENGTLRLEWRDFPYLGQESVNAAVAARAAQEQGKFWEYHDILYQNQKGENSGAFSDENLIGFAREAGLDVESLVGDGMALPLADGAFDVAFSMFGLMFFPDRPRGFRELRRVLVREGLWVVELVSDYGGQIYTPVLIIELRDGKMWRDTRYYAEPFEASEWRSQWVEQMEP